MILLYANDSNFYDKLYSPIKDEYDMNKYQQEVQQEYQKFKK